MVGLKLLEVERIIARHALVADGGLQVVGHLEVVAEELNLCHCVLGFVGYKKSKEARLLYVRPPCREDIGRGVLFSHLGQLAFASELDGVGAVLLVARCE